MPPNDLTKVGMDQFSHMFSYLSSKKSYLNCYYNEIILILRSSL
jgi:hypothetical protein